ncbi:host cell division inhibitor Icd-like protein [Serratia fonticola]|uniref:host cell division inhibitor Icd-like protein n=2 Tax=Serratia fonticola TaxID=47917 RepID=UPI0027EDD2BB|nr:host cell division inhibitor Icd-like protein [Serratia fonticola]MDQ7209885.1 host cell division inhibitor Icd-like protein [Serratia fonticola]
MWNGGDFPAPLGWLSLTVTSFSIDMCTPIDLSLFSLGVHTNMRVPKKTTPPNGITSTERGLTTNDRLSIEVAMLDHTQTRPKFQYIFAALERDNMAAGSVLVSVEAETLYEAKAKLKARYTATFYRKRQPVDTGSTKYTWRFLAIDRIDREAKPCRLSVEAYTEQEARRELAPHFILSLAARLPVQEVSHV